MDASWAFHQVRLCHQLLLTALKDLHFQFEALNYKLKIIGNEKDDLGVIITERPITLWPPIGRSMENCKLEVLTSIQQ